MWKACYTKLRLYAFAKSAPMKLLSLILFLLVITLILFQTYFTMATSKTVRQPYKILKTEKEYEVRYYPAATVATIEMAARSYKELSATAFRKLSSFILGGNQARKNIAITLPVYMDLSNSVSSVSFVMPSEYNKGNLPTPNDSAIVITTMQGEYVAAIQFGGYANEANIKTHTARLESGLKANGIMFYGSFRLLSYNAPFQFLGKRNEIIVSIRW